MAKLLLSEAEKVFIYHGIQDEIRCDGRACDDYRPLELRTDFLPNTNGSARVRLGTTDVLVGIKADICTPHKSEPDKGLLQFSVTCSSNATPAFEGRGGDSLAVELSNVMTQMYNHPNALDLHALCLVEQEQCWVLHVDIMILECGGNLYDIIAIAVKAALFNAKIPKVTVTTGEGGVKEVEISDDLYDYTRLDVTNTPCCVTVSKIGKTHLVDASPEEEVCCLASLVIGVNSKGKVTSIHKHGGGSLHYESIKAMIESAKKVGVMLNERLMESLKEEESLGDVADSIGFLR